MYPSIKRTFRLETLHLFIVSLGFICAFIFLGCDHKTNYTAQNPAADVDYETYRFPTRNVTGFKELIAEDSIPYAEGVGYLFLPIEASQTNKVPLMIILHGSGGTWGGRGERHAEFLNLRFYNQPSGEVSRESPVRWKSARRV